MSDLESLHSNRFLLFSWTSVGRKVQKSRIWIQAMLSSELLLCGGDYRSHAFGLDRNPSFEAAWDWGHAIVMLRRQVLRLSDRRPANLERRLKTR